MINYPPSYYESYKKLAMSQQGVAIPFQSYQVSTFSSSNESSVHHLIKSDTRGVKSIYTVMRPNQSLSTNWSGTNWSHYDIQSYFYRLGSEVHPNFTLSKDSSDSTYSNFFQRLLLAHNRAGDVSGTLLDVRNYSRYSESGPIQNITAIATSTGTATLTIADVSSFKVHDSVYLVGFKAGGTTDNSYLLNNKILTVTAVDTTANTISVLTYAPFAADSIALDGTKTQLFHLKSADGTIADVGHFAIAENLEDTDITHTPNGRVIDLKDKGPLVFEAEFNTTNQKQISHILLLQRLLFIQNGQVTVY